MTETTAAQLPHAPPNADALVDVAGQGMVNRLAAGTGRVQWAIRTTMATPQLRSLAIIPIILNALFFAATLWFLARFHGAVVKFMQFSEASEGFWGILNTLYLSLVGIVAWFVLGGLALVLTVVIVSIIAGPIYDLLSERTEVLLCGQTFAPEFTLRGFVADLASEVALQIMRLLIYLAGSVLIGAIAIIPAIGQIIGAPLGLIWTWWFLALEMFNPSMARHRLPASQRVKLIFDHKLLSLGFGAASWAVLFLPITMPFLVVAGTRLFVEGGVYQRFPSKIPADFFRTAHAQSGAAS